MNDKPRILLIDEPEVENILQLKSDIPVLTVLSPTLPAGVYCLVKAPRAVLPLDDVARTDAVTSTDNFVDPSFPQIQTMSIKQWIEAHNPKSKPNEAVSNAIKTIPAAAEQVDDRTTNDFGKLFT